MSALQAAFAQLTAQVQNVLSVALAGPMGPMVRAYLPQVWVFETEQGARTLAVDAAGRATSFPRGMVEREVTVQRRQDPLLRGLARGSAGPPPPPEAPRGAHP